MSPERKRSANEQDVSGTRTYLIERGMTAEELPGTPAQVQTINEVLRESGSREALFELFKTEMTESGGPNAPSGADRPEKQTQTPSHGRGRTGPDTPE